MSPDETTSDRRGILEATAAGGLGVAGLAGCLGIDDRSDSRPGETATPVSLDGDDPGSDDRGEDADGRDDDAIAIGVLAPMNLPVGESTWNAARMAAEEINADGGVLGTELAVELGDTEVSPGRAESEHRRLVDEEDCEATVGLFLGAALLQTLPSIADSETVHLTTGAMEPRAGRLVSRTESLTGDPPEEEHERYRYHFRTGPLHLRDQADAMVEFLSRRADRRGWRRAALLTENLGELTPYAERLEARLDGVLETPMVERTGGVSDWDPVYDDVESADCDLALVAFTLGGTTAVNQWAAQERDFEFGGVHVPSQAFEYWENTDGRVEHVFATNVATPQTENTAETRPFFERYADRWDAVPSYTGAITYDAVYILKLAVERAAESEGTSGPPAGDTLVRHLEALTFTDGTIVPEFEFTSPEAKYAHEPRWNSMTDDGVPVVQQWQYDPETREDYGTMHAVAPGRNATAAYDPPGWIER